jgi:predicted Holliday junction resolvase-like endonuclease
MSLETVIAAVLFIIAIALIILCGILAYLYFSLRQEIARKIQEARVLWREKELEILRKEQREIALKESLAQLESWRQQEIESVRKQQLEFARNEVQVQFEQWKITHTKDIRQDAIQKSQSVIAGKVTEHFVPYLPEFTYNPKDARFLGTPIDLIVFDGLDQGQIKSIVFAEVKTGSSTMNARERQVRDAVRAGKVEWVEIRPQLDFDTAVIGENDEKPVSDMIGDEPKVESPEPASDKKDTAKRLDSILKK